MGETKKSSKSTSKTNGRRASNGDSQKTATTRKKAVTPSKSENVKTLSFGDTLLDEVIIILVVLFCIIAIISLFTNKTGVVGGLISSFLKGLFGVGGYIIPFSAIGYCVWLLKSETKNNKVLKLVGMLMCIILIGGVFSAFNTETFVRGSNIFERIALLYKNGSATNGGLLGGAFGNIFASAFGKIGATLVLIAFLIISFIMATGKSFFAGVSKAYSYNKEMVQEYSKARNERIAQERKIAEKNMAERQSKPIQKRKMQDIIISEEEKIPEEGPYVEETVFRKREPRRYQKADRSIYDFKIDVETNKEFSFERDFSEEESRIVTEPTPEIIINESVRKPDFFSSPIDEDLNEYSKYSVFGTGLKTENNDVKDKKEDVSEIEKKVFENIDDLNSDIKDVTYDINASENPFSFDPFSDDEEKKEDLKAEETEETKEDFNATKVFGEEEKKEYFENIQSKSSVEETEVETEYIDDDNAMIERAFAEMEKSLNGDVYADDIEDNTSENEEVKVEEYKEENSNSFDDFSFKDTSSDFTTEVKPETHSTSYDNTEKVEVKEPVPPLEEKKEYVFPPIELLGEDKNVQSSGSKLEMVNNAKKLEETLKSFGVDAKVIQINRGPTVTRYELSPSQGVKVSKIVNLADDIALNLAASGIRIEAPIPGKAAVGIEVPNGEPQSVYLRTVIESDEFKDFPSKLAFAVGKDISGSCVVADIAKMPHLLIAGATGSGKSVCINTLITSLIYKANPDEVKLILVDPKVVELSIYNGIPHLLIPVVTDPKKASSALNWAVREMDKRYEEFATTNVRNLQGYNAKKKEKGETDFMPQIVIIIDELADLMMTAPGEVEDAICRLAQKARAAGIHLIIATQRPSVDVITGIIKANIPSRIAFSVSSGIDSRTILDTTGAEKLLGKGDMLFCPMGSNKPIRIQGAFITDEEVESIVDFVKQDGHTVYDTSMIDEITSSSKNISGGEDLDEHFEDAIELVVKKEKASVSMLQRYFRIGYNRAANLMEALEDRGIVGPEEGSKPRKVLMSQEEYEEFKEQGGYMG